MKFSILIYIFLILTTSFGANETERIFLIQNRFYSASLKALADAGIALPGEISSGLINPALTFSSHQLFAQSQGTIMVGYGRDSTLNHLILPLGLTYSTSEGTIGLFYRFSNGRNELKQHELTLNIAGQLFSKLDQQGAVDFGLNLRFEKMVWGRVPSESELFFADDSSNWKIANVKNDTAGPFGSIVDKRILLDIGFYQPQILENLDFGLTIKNLLGYVWTYGNSQNIEFDTLKDAAGLDSAMIKKTALTGSKKSSRHWTKKDNRTFCAGVVYHASLGKDKLMLNFPVDMEIIGFLDKDVKNHYIFRSGIEAAIGKYIILRFGYSRAPGELKSVWKEIRNINVFTGGAGFRISSFSVNFFITENSFGTTASIDY